MIIPVIFSTIPTAADAATPKVLIIEVMTKKENVTKTPCSATGIPILKISFVLSLSYAISFFEKENGNFRFLMMMIDKITLIAWAITVASAAPFAPMLNTATKIKSSIIFAIQAIKTVSNGVLESPMPLKTLPKRL